MIDIIGFIKTWRKPFFFIGLVLLVISVVLDTAAKNQMNMTANVPDIIALVFSYTALSFFMVYMLSFLPKNSVNSSNQASSLSNI